MFKMTRLALFIIFSFFIYMAPVYSSEFELPNKVDVALVPNVTYSSNDSCFIYEYTAVSSNSSVQEVCNLFFPTTELCSNVESPSGWSGDFAQKVHRTWPESKMVIWFASWANDDPKYSVEAYRTIIKDGKPSKEERLSKDRYLTFNRIEEINN